MHGDIDVFYTYTNSPEFQFSAINVRLTSTHSCFTLRPSFDHNRQGTVTYYG